MPQAADIGSKRLINLAPDAWVQWVTDRPGVTARDVLASEFQWVSRESDVLVKAYDPEQGEFLVLNELQLRYTADMPRRMRAYAALAEERYRLPTYPVLVNILPPPATVTVIDRYDSTFLGIRAHQDYRVINLWEVDVNLVFEQPLPSLLPFVPVLRGGNEAAVVRQALQMLRRDEQLNQLESLLAFFASFVLDTALVQQIMRWDMLVLEESPWYQEILQKGEERGLQQGLQQGLQAIQRQIVKMLHRRFGEVPEAVEAALQTKDVGALEELLDAAIEVNSLEEFNSYLL